MNKKRILITGGAGFIGSHLAESLLSLGHHVTIIDDLSTGRMKNIENLIPNKGFQFAIETILNEQVMDRLISEHDMIYHLAAAVGVNLIIEKQTHTLETNILGTDAVLKIANRYKKPVVIASTSEVYGKNNKPPYREIDDSVFGPTYKSRWGYACSKAIDEFLALAYFREKKLPVVIIRFFNTVGPRQSGQYGMVIPRFVKCALKNEPITVYGDGTQTRCFGHVTDVCNGLVNLIDNKEALGMVINLGSQEEISIKDLAQKIKELSNSKSEIKYISYDEAYAPGFEDMFRRVPDIDRARRILKFNPVTSLDQIILDVIDYYKTNEVE